MERKHNKDIVPIAKSLRKNMTKEERHLWYDFLKTYPIKFSRQKVMGKYVVDFYSAQAKLVIELDGSQHYEEKQLQKDIDRTAYLEQYGLKVIRIPNNQVNLHFREVCEYIDLAVKQQSPSQLTLTATDGGRPLCRFATFPHTVGNHPLHKGAEIEGNHPCAKGNEATKINLPCVRGGGTAKQQKLASPVQGEVPRYEAEGLSVKS